MPRTELADEQWRAIYERVLAGETHRTLDRENGFSDGTVSKMLQRRFGYRPRGKQPAMTWDVSDALYERVKAGESINAIAAELGMESNANLYRLMETRYGYEPKVVRRRAVWAPTVHLDKFSDTDLAYVAGIIDGEGSIIQINRTRKHPLWVVKVNMTDRPVIEWLATLGGRFGVRPSRDPGHLKEQYEWKVHRQIDVQTLLTGIVAYMRVKRDKAELVLNYYAETPNLACEWTADEVEVDRRRRAASRSRVA